MTSGDPDHPPDVLLVRHAPTSWSGRRYCGRSDPALSAAGRRVADRVARDLREALAPETRVVTSAARRARATAAVIAEAAGIASVEVDPRWCEVDFGIAEGRTFDELAQIAPEVAERILAGAALLDWPGGETAEDFRTRVSDAWAATVASPTAIVVVSHAGPIRIALGLASGRPPETVAPPPPGSVHRVPR